MLVTSETRPGKRFPKLKLHSTCAQMHPGLCRTVDDDVYELALHVAVNLNTLFSNLTKWGAVGRGLRFKVFSTGVETKRGYKNVSHVIVCKIRHARPRVQMFSHVPTATWDEAMDQAQCLLQRAGCDMFSVCTSYAFAAMLIRRSLGMGAEENEEFVVAFATAAIAERPLG